MIEDDRLRDVAARIGNDFVRRRLNVSTAESCTGGFIAKVLTDIPGSSELFSEAVVTYSNESKMRLLGVSYASLKRHGAVSEQVARQMAVGALRRSGTSVSVAVTGIAGPGGGSPGKPVGTVWLAWAMRVDRGHKTVVTLRRFRGDRDNVRRKTVLFALHGLQRITR